MGGGIAGQQRSGLVVRAGPPQAAEQDGHVIRVVEGGVGDRSVGQYGDLVARARLPQGV